MTIDPNSRLVDVLKRRRMAMGFTQLRLAKKVDVSATTVSSWETGERKPGAAVVPDLSEALQVDADVLASLIVSA